MRKPVIGIPADRRLLGSHWFHCVGEKYINAIVQAADGVPVLVPAVGERYLREWLASFDGILFTGSPSNVEPHRYRGGRVEAVETPAYRAGSGVDRVLDAMAVQAHRLCTTTAAAELFDEGGYATQGDERAQFFDRGRNASGSNGSCPFGFGRKCPCLPGRRDAWRYRGRPGRLVSACGRC